MDFALLRKKDTRTRKFYLKNLKDSRKKMNKIRKENSRKND